MCNCVVEVTVKVASHLESQGVEIVGTPVMDAALMLDSMHCNAVKLGNPKCEATE